MVSLNKETTKLEQKRSKLIERIFTKQDRAGRWSYDLKIKTRYRHYLPKYKSTLWTLVTLADLKCPPNDKRAKKSLKLIEKNMYKKEHGLFGWTDETYGAHEPSPCLNAHIIYLHFYFGGRMINRFQNVIKFFNKFQRFDDGDFKAAEKFPYKANSRCFGKHTCYWGVTKLFKGLSFIPLTERTKESHSLMRKCIGFIFDHEVCYSSKNRKRFLHSQISKLTFPNMWQSDFLEILWLLTREGKKDKSMNKAIKLLRSKRKKDSTWKLERSITNLITSVGKRGEPNDFITERAKEVLDFWDKTAGSY
ncbi:MAG: hypothetical protein PHS44_01540 [Candidatus Dojkabacteria bacterium]|jgi:hypothetical protein|nr:hypothetical protein [Candidatus Dojkabacteria bacterium]